MRYKLLAAVAALAGILFLIRFLGLSSPPAAANEPENLEPTIIYVVIEPTPEAARRAPTPPKPPPSRTPTPRPANAVNGIAINRIAVVSNAARQQIRKIYARGQSFGRNPRAVSKIGDSTMLYPVFLEAFDQPGSYRLGAYSYLQRTIDHFAGSFARTSAAVRVGMHTWSEFDPTWVARNDCLPGETPLDCELRLNNPSVAIIRLGANDTEDPVRFEQELRHIVSTCISSGVIPILGTKPDRLEGPQNTLNKIVARVATANNIPLWDYDLAASTIPGKGLLADKVHFEGDGTHDYRSASSLQHVGPLEDLTALLALDAVRSEMLTAGASK